MNNNEEKEFTIKIVVQGETTRPFKAKTREEAFQQANEFYMESTSIFTEYYLITSDSITVENPNEN